MSKAARSIQLKHSRLLIQQLLLLKPLETISLPHDVNEKTVPSVKDFKSEAQKLLE